MRANFRTVETASIIFADTDFQTTTENKSLNTSTPNIVKPNMTQDQLQANKNHKNTTMLGFTMLCVIKEHFYSLVIEINIVQVVCGSYNFLGSIIEVVRECLWNDGTGSKKIVVSVENETSPGKLSRR